MSHSNKKHYLLIWPTIRQDWIQVFKGLECDFQFTFLPSTFPQEPNYASDFSCRYWSEFSSAQEVLKEVQPDGVIFMSIESGLNMVLNNLAKELGLKTFILQHGIYTNYKDYRNREKLWRKRALAADIKKLQISKGFNSLKFINNSLDGVGKLALPKIALYTKLQQYIGPYWASKNLPLKMKRAGHYLCFSPYNATIHKETDCIDEIDITYVGCPELKGYLAKVDDPLNEDFYLHVDQALAENSFGEETISIEKMIDFYLKLNDYCLAKEAKLYIKLHPESYHTDWLPKHDNIKYLSKVVDFNRYIQSAKGCFGFYSTMVIPAIYWKPTVLFRIQYSGLQEAIGKLNVGLILDFWDLRIEDIFFSKSSNQKQIRQTFIQPDDTSHKSLLESLNNTY